MESKLKAKKTAPINTIINFFAFQYDLVYYCLKVSVDFFAYQYDLVENFIKFLLEYVEWISDIRSIKSPAFVKLVEEPIQIHK